MQCLLTDVSFSKLLKDKTIFISLSGNLSDTGPLKCPNPGNTDHFGSTRNYKVVNRITQNCVRYVCETVICFWLWNVKTWLKVHFASYAPFILCRYLIFVVLEDHEMLWTIIDYERVHLELLFLLCPPSASSISNLPDLLRLCLYFYFLEQCHRPPTASTYGFTFYAWTL